MKFFKDDYLIDVKWIVLHCITLFELKFYTMRYTWGAA